MAENNTELNSTEAEPSCISELVSLPTQVGLTIAYIFVFMVALFGNSLVILVVYRHPKLKTTFNMFIVNMAAADILGAITVVPYSLVYLYERSRWFSGGFALFLCKLIPFLASLSIGTSVLTMAAITFDRYLAIIRTMRRPLSPKFTVTAIALTWIISSAVFATELYKFKLYAVPHGVICAPRWVHDLIESHKISKYEMLIRFLLLYVIPLIGMAIVYSKIIFHLWRRRFRSGKIGKKKVHKIEKQKRTVITMLVTIVMVFALCWLPAHVNHFIVTMDLDTFKCLPESLVLSFYFLSHANSAINPCLYLVFNESFRKGLARSASLGYRAPPGAGIEGANLNVDKIVQVGRK